MRNPGSNARRQYVAAAYDRQSIHPSGMGTSDALSRANRWINSKSVSEVKGEI